MKLTRMDIILLILVMTISMIFYVFVGDKLSQSYRLVIILIVGFTVGILKRLYVNKTNR